MIRFFVMTCADDNDEAQKKMRSTCMLTTKIKTRLTKDRPMTNITIRMPVDVIESMKNIAPKKGFSGYQTLLKTYISAGLRKDEAEKELNQTGKFIANLKKYGVSDEIIAKAMN